MKKKSYELMKDIRTQQVLGAGSMLDEEAKLATEIFCELNNIDLEKYLRKWNDVLIENNETINYLYGKSSGNQLYIFYRAMIDELTKEFIKECE